MTTPPSSGPGVPPSPDAEHTRRDRVREQLSDKRVLAVIGATALGVVLLAAFVVVPALGSNNSDDSALPAVHRAVHSHPASSSASSTPSVDPTQSAELQVRDPFSALASASAGAAPVVATSAPPTTAPPVISAQPSVPVQTVTTIRPPTAPPSNTQSQIALTQVILDKINSGATAATSTAQVEVNGLPYTVSLNKMFGPGIRMTAITSTSATFVYGGQTVTIVVGEFGLFAGAN